MTKLSRRVIATAAAVVTLGAGGMTVAATAASAAPASPAAPIQRCAPGQLYVWVSPDSANGTAGTTYYNLDFTNKSGSECYLNGWPAVTATNSRGGQLGGAATQIKKPSAKTVYLYPNATAHSTLGYVDALLTRSSRPQTATFLRVSVPGVRGSRNAFFPLPVTTRGRSIFTIGSVQGGV
jgi:hypothetical protein